MNSSNFDKVSKTYHRNLSEDRFTAPSALSERDARELFSGALSHPSLASFAASGDAVGALIEVDTVQFQKTAVKYAPGLSIDLLLLLLARACANEHDVRICGEHYDSLMEHIVDAAVFHTVTPEKIGWELCWRERFTDFNEDDVQVEVGHPIKWNPAVVDYPVDIFIDTEEDHEYKFSAGGSNLHLKGIVRLHRKGRVSYSYPVLYSVEVVESD